MSLTSLISRTISHNLTSLSLSLSLLCVFPPLFKSTVVPYPVDPATRQAPHFRKGTNGVSTNGVTATVVFLDRDSCWYSHLICFPQNARTYLFSNPAKLITFAAAPLVLTPFSPQPNAVSAPPARRPGEAPLSEAAPSSVLVRRLRGDALAEAPNRATSGVEHILWC